MCDNKYLNNTNKKSSNNNFNSSWQLGLLIISMAFSFGIPWCPNYQHSIKSTNTY